MGSIEGLTCIFGMPEEDERERNVSLGQAADGSWKRVIFGNNRKILTIPIHGLSTEDKNTLLANLESSASKMVMLIPDSHINLGGGSGNGAFAQLLDEIIDFQKINHNKWSGEFTFAFAYYYFVPDDDVMYFKNDVEITGTYESPQAIVTNTAPLATQENGEVYPNIYLGAYKVTILIQSSKGCEATFGWTNLQQSGDNISFNVYMSAAGRPATDGKYYASISISIKAIP